MLLPPSAPEPRFVYEAVVDIGERRSLGRGPLGERFIVPILGGHFEGGRLRGTILTGGADRQLLRPDGIKELDAVYGMQTEEGDVIGVRNRVLIDESLTPMRYARCVLELTAPTGNVEWLNRRVFVGTLQSLRPARAAVSIRVFELG